VLLPVPGEFCHKRREAFEAELSAVLAALCPGGDYTEDVRLEVLLGRRSGADG